MVKTYCFCLLLYSTTSSFSLLLFFQPKNTPFYRLLIKNKAPHPFCSSQLFNSPFLQSLIFFSPTKWPKFLLHVVAPSDMVLLQKESITLDKKWVSYGQFTKVCQIWPKVGFFHLFWEEFSPTLKNNSDQVCHPTF